MTAGLPSRLLIVAAFFHPRPGVRSHRWTVLVREFAALGVQVDVVTASLATGAQPLECPGVRVFHVSDPAARLRRSFGRTARQRKPGQMALPDQGLRLRPRSFVERLARAVNDGLWTQIRWPDSECLWYFAARRTADRLVRQDAYDAVVTVVPAFTAMLVGRALVRRHDRLPWLLDIGDPLSLPGVRPNNVRLYRALNRRTECEAFRSASAITVTFEGAARAYAETFPESAPKLYVIPPLLDGVQADATGTPRSGEAVRLVYVGTFYPGLREPRFLLSLIRELSRQDREKGIELHVYGDIGKTRDQFETVSQLLDREIRIHGIVPRAEALRALREADVLVNVGNSTRHQLPSKVVEYAAIGKPVLNVAAGTDDSSAGFLAPHPDCLSVVDTGGEPTAAQVASVATFLEGLPRSIPEDALESWLSPYRAEQVARRYLDILCSIGRSVGPEG